MKTALVFLISIVVLFTAGNPKLTPGKRTNSLNACMKLRRQAPYLNLNCEGLLESQSEQKSETREEKVIKTFSVDTLKASTKKIEKRDEEKLKEMIKSLKENSS